MKHGLRASWLLRVAALAASACVSRQPEPLLAVDPTPHTPTPSDGSQARGRTAEGPSSRRAFSPFRKKTGNEYSDRFVALWNDIHDPSNGYFSAKGIPYHAV